MFDPAPRPAGRLARLGVVFDASTAAERIPGLARMCERAGIDVVWIADGLIEDELATDQAAKSDALVIAGALQATLARMAVGVLVSSRRLREALLVATEPPPDPRPRIEVGIVDAGKSSLEGSVVAAQAGGDTRVLNPLGPRVRLSAAVSDVESTRVLLPLVDEIILPGWWYADLESAADEARAQCAEMSREVGTLGVGALLPVSVGRTQAEASARAEMDNGFARFGDPAEVGIFGTLEECQDRVIALAHAGVTDLLCLLPRTDDVHDVVAQLTGITIGTTDVLQPGSLRSEAPPPPDGWGGRPERHPTARVSGGSRRR